MESGTRLVQGLVELGDFCYFSKIGTIHIPTNRDKPGHSRLQHRMQIRRDGKSDHGHHSRSSLHHVFRHFLFFFLVSSQLLRVCCCPKYNKEAQDPSPVLFGLKGNNLLVEPVFNPSGGAVPGRIAQLFEEGHTFIINTSVGVALQLIPLE